MTRTNMDKKPVLDQFCRHTSNDDSLNRFRRVIGGSAILARRYQKVKGQYHTHQRLLVQFFLDVLYCETTEQSREWVTQSDP